jgi:hypothetical protein
MNDFDKITPLQRALLESVSIPDLAVGGLPQIKLLQSNSQDLLNSPDNPWYLEGAMAGGFAAPGREGRVFIPVPPGFHSGAFAFVQEWIEGELDAEGEFQQIGEPHAVKPIDAIWRKDPITGKKVFKRDNGHLMREHINCLMKVEETGQIGRYVFAKTALRIGREFANASQRLKAEGLDNVRGCVLGRYRWTSRLEKQDTRRWFLPVQTLAGKLGQPGGPTFETVLELAELRKTFLAGLPPMLEIEGPPEPPVPPSIDGPPEPPPYERNPDDDVDFGP